ncbi:MAG: major capsid family protein [Pseudomonadota bacterium]
MQTQKIQVVDSIGAPAVAEIGHCGRDKCKHVHIAEDRFIDLHERFKGIGPGIGITVEGGRGDTRNPRFGARDAQEALFFLVSQLAYTEAGLFERSYQPMQYKDLIPQDYSAGEANDTIRYEIYDEVGEMDDINPASDDIPTADAFYADKTFGIHHSAIGYEYTTQELRATAFLRRPLPERKLHAAMNAYERFLNVVGLSGRAKKNLTGLLNNTTVAHAVAPSGLAWSAASGITPAQIISDFNFGLNAVWAGSKFTVIPDTVAVPSFAWQYINAVPASGTAGPFQISVLKYLLDNNLSKAKGVNLNIVPVYRANTVANGGTGPGASAASRTVYYRKSDQDLVQHVPLPLRFLAPQLVGLKVKIPGEARYSGVEVRRPPSFYYQDGN